MVLPILSGIAAAFVIAILIIGGVFAYTIFGNKTVGHAVVDFRGHTYTQVLADYGNVFSFEAKYEYNSDYEPGIVIAQSQNEGKVIKKTQKIILTVSQGNVQTDVPATEGLTVSAAAALLTKSKLAYEIRYIETDAYTAGTVITTSFVIISTNGLFQPLFVIHVPKNAPNQVLNAIVKTTIIA